MRSTPEDGPEADAEAPRCAQPGRRASLWTQHDDGAGRWHLGQRQSHTATTREAKSQAHPPAAGGQPLPLFEQHQAFLATDQPAIQFAKPASQSYGSAMGAIGATVAQPPP